VTLSVENGAAQEVYFQTLRAGAGTPAAEPAGIALWPGRCTDGDAVGSRERAAKRVWFQTFVSSRADGEDVEGSRKVGVPDRALGATDAR
jgi:hypothetical protein